MLSKIDDNRDSVLDLEFHCSPVSMDGSGIDEYGDLIPDFNVEGANINSLMDICL